MGPLCSWGTRATAQRAHVFGLTTQLHCGGHLGGRAQLPDTILEEDHPMTIPSKFGLIELLVPDKMVFM